MTSDIKVQNKDMDNFTLLSTVYILWTSNNPSKYGSLKCFTVKTVTYIMTIYGQESPGWISLFKLVTFFCWKYTETSFFLVKFIGQWIPDRDGRGIARDIKKFFSTFSKLDKKW